MNMVSCPNCNAKLDEGSKFCGECGAKMMTSPLEVKPSKQNNLGTLKIGAVMLGLLLILSLTSGSDSPNSSADGSSNNPTGNLLAKVQNCRDVQESYIEQVPQQITKSNTENLFDNKVSTISASSYNTVKFYIDVANKFSNVISGNIAETAGYDITFFVFDQKNYNAWVSGQNYAPYVSRNKIKSGSFSFVPDHADYYYFVFDNRYSMFTNKVPQITANWDYQYTTTEYVDVTKYRTVQKCD